MSIGRRASSDSRRRRILIYQSCRSDQPAVVPDRRLAERLRQARRAPMIYGSNVNRRLRGRWFSLVPVRRRMIAAVAATIMGVVMLLCLGHWAATFWQPLAYRPEIARPLRLDRPDAFGSWVRSVFLAAAAFTAVLVYQLRRYRNDDFRGSYRIWPPVIVLIAIASIDSICGIVPWCGELIDLVLGRRVALAGSDWIRIALTVGGAALSLRLVAEVRRSKLAVCMMVAAACCFAIPLASRWGVISSDTPTRWFIVTCSPLMAAATLWIACGAYLRRLFREVRRLDEEDLFSLRLQQWQQRIASRFLGGENASPALSANAASAEKVVKPKAAVDGGKTAKATKSTPRSVQAADSGADSGDTEPVAGTEPGEGKSKRRWSLWPRRRQRDRADSQPNPEVKEPSTTSKPDNQQPVSKAPAPELKKPAGNADESAQPAEVKPRAKGNLLGRWFAKRKESETTDPTAAEQPTKTTAASQTRAATPPRQDDRHSGGDAQSDVDPQDDPADDSDIDWSSMSKAERRRLRRELKRAG